VYVGLSFLGALATSIACRGVRRTVGSLWFLLVMWAIVAVANCAFSTAGSTELIMLFGHSFKLEALCYGLTTGCMLAAVLLWFMSYTAIMDSEASAAVFGTVLPTVSLMVSQVLRLVPQFIRRGQAVGAVQNAMSAAAPKTKKDSAASNARLLSVLMGWGMEDGLQRSDAMRARGYGCGVARTRYRRQRFAVRDAVFAVALVVLVGVNVFLAAVACSQFSFYPYMDTLVMWWGYIPYVVLMLVPAALAARERALWR
jgi:energy-coupling factor transport system permease protein